MMLFKLDIPSTVGGYPDAPVQEMVRFVPGESSGDRRLAVTGVSGKVAHPVASMARTSIAPVMDAATFFVLWMNTYISDVT